MRGAFLQLKIKHRSVLLFFILLLLAASACTGPSSDLNNVGGGGPLLGGIQDPPQGGLVPPEIPSGGSTQEAAPPLEAGAVGPLTDCSKAMLVLSCEGSLCLKKPKIPDVEDSRKACDAYSYKVRGTLMLSIHSVPIPDRVIRILDRDTGKFQSEERRVGKE